MANLIRNLSAIAGAFFLCFAFVGTMSPASAATFTFDLYDHPDGAIGSADYGLRLDNEPNDRFFSFNTGTAQLFVDNLGNGDGGAGEALIEGTVFENNSDDGSFGIWVLDYTWSGVVMTDASAGAFTATGGSGTLTQGSTTIDLGFAVNGTGYAMIFNDDGHRINQAHSDALTALVCPPTTCWVGRGWIDKEPYNDFLFVAELADPQNAVVPLPAALPLLLSGLGLMGWFSRRRKCAVAAA